MRRRHLPDKLVEQQGRCGICGEQLSEGKGQSHVDHRVPKSRGGSDAAENVHLVCASCNRRKGVRTLDEFLVQMTFPFSVPS